LITLATRRIILTIGDFVLKELDAKIESLRFQLFRWMAIYAKHALIDYINNKKNKKIASSKKYIKFIFNSETFKVMVKLIEYR
jgi:hypothetical protein